MELTCPNKFWTVQPFTRINRFYRDYLTIIVQIANNPNNKIAEIRTMHR
jgi:hypothetical protein